MIIIIIIIIIIIKIIIIYNAWRGVNKNNKKVEVIGDENIVRKIKGVVPCDGHIANINK